MHHKFIEVDGSTISFLEAGQGPTVLMCHGFPETAYSWRHQIPALAAARYRAIAPDLRGYGKSLQPLAADEYTVFHAVGDIIGLLDALLIDNAVIVGSDWGATVAWQTALMRPDRIKGVIALGVPMMDRAPMLPTQMFPRMEDSLFYTLYFQEAGVAERELEHDVRMALRKIYFAASGDAGARQPGDGTPNPFGMVSRAKGILASLPDPVSLPGWLTESDLDTYTAAFIQSGFRGGLNYYRNLDRNWQLQSCLAGIRITVPALFAIGSRDCGLQIPGMDRIIADMPQRVSDLRGSQIVQDAGHWLQQERPKVVNEMILSFVHDVFAAPI